MKTGTQSENRSMRGAVGLEHRDSGIQRLRYDVTYPQVVSQAPHHFRSSETQPACDGSSIVQAVETKGRDFVLDTSSDRKPVTGIEGGVECGLLFWP